MDNIHFCYNYLGVFQLSNDKSTKLPIINSYKMTCYMSDVAVIGSIDLNAWVHLDIDNQYMTCGIL